jgi:hypothetical protein
MNVAPVPSSVSQDTAPRKTEAFSDTDILSAFGKVGKIDLPQRAKKSNPTGRGLPGRP